MSLIIAGYEFEGPYLVVEDLQDRSGVYVILDRRDEKYIVIDVGESHAVKSRVTNHERKDCWKKHCENGIWLYAVYYTPHLQQPGRKEIEQKIREMYNPPCGEQ